MHAPARTHAPLPGWLVVALTALAAVALHAAVLDPAAVNAFAELMATPMQVVWTGIVQLGARLFGLAA